MKKDLDTKIFNMDGSDAMLSPEVPLTIKHCIQEALLNACPTATAEEKSRRWGLARKSCNGGMINITEAEAQLIKVSAEIHQTLLYGQIVDWVDGIPEAEAG